MLASSGSSLQRSGYSVGVLEGRKSNHQSPEENRDRRRIRLTRERSVMLEESDCDDLLEGDYWTVITGQCLPDSDCRTVNGKQPGRWMVKESSRSVAKSPSR